MRHNCDFGLGRIAVAHDQYAVLADALTGVDFSSLRRRILPNDLLVRADHARTGHLREDDVSIGQQGGIVELLNGAGPGSQGHGILPGNLAFSHDEDGLFFGLARISFPGVKEWMQSRSRGGQRRRSTCVCQVVHNIRQLVACEDQVVVISTDQSLPVVIGQVSRVPEHPP